MTKNMRIAQFEEFMTPAFKQSEIRYFVKNLNRLGFFDAPASISHHANTSGGLFDHSLCVAKCLVDLTEKLDLGWKNKRSPYLVGMFHDLCKCDNYKFVRPAEGDTEHWEYNNASILPGHGEKSVIMAQMLLRLTDEETACIRWHMGAFDVKENWNSYGRACTVYPNVLFTHTADMMAAKVIGV